MMLWQDPVVEAIHQYRETYAKRFYYDVWAINEDLKAKQRQYEQQGWRVVSLVPESNHQLPVVSVEVLPS